jgi:hypothetical protein
VNVASRIRVIEEREPISFGERLEKEAREMVTTRDSREANDSITFGIRREIALILDHMDRVRSLHSRLRRNLLQHEFYLSTEISQREPRGHQVYHDYRLPERDRLRDRLRELERERRHLAMVEGDQMRGLRDRLSGLMGRHALLHG